MRETVETGADGTTVLDSDGDGIAESRDERDDRRLVHQRDALLLEHVSCFAAALVGRQPGANPYLAAGRQASGAGRTEGFPLFLFR